MRCDTTLPTRIGSTEIVSRGLQSCNLQLTPKFPGFVLSAGHACLLQYLYLHFSGYEAWTLDQIRQYHAPVMSGSMAAGHPEIEYPGKYSVSPSLLFANVPDTGVEVTTGPLGQGIANAVGLAMASKQLAATYNKDDLKVVDNKIWCFTGDGCLQEGVGQECRLFSGQSLPKAEQ
jgi:dihydroxyacetone synthase